MRNKKIFSFDEEKDAEKIYNQGFPNGIDYTKMYLVAKYIRQTYGIGEIRLEKELIKYCQKQDVNFNPIKESDSIRRWINSAMNYNLRKIESVFVSENEISFLRNIENSRNRKILYTILLLSKALKRSNVKRKKKGKFQSSDYYYMRYSNFQDIIRLSHLNNLSETDLADILHEYKEHFTFYNPERELIRVNYADTKHKCEIEIGDLDNMINYYNIIFEQHKPTSKCIKCGREIKKNSNRQKTCPECSKLLARERKTRWRIKHKKEIRE